MKLLVAEDDPALLRGIRACLTENHYDVDTACDGEEALSLLSRGRYDGLVLDLMMPKTDGFGVLSELKRRNDATPVLILSARAEVEDKVNGLRAGANDYLTKPFDVRELLARVDVLTRRTSEREDCLCFGNVTLNLGTCVLSTPVGSFPLVNKEFRLLSVFLSAPNRVFSPEVLLDTVWGVESDATTESVRVYISYLRRKLEALNADVRIKALRNLGYVLEARP